MWTRRTLALVVIATVLTRHAVWTLACSFAMLIATGITVFVGTASVSIPAAGASVETTQWAGWVGFGLAALTAAAAARAARNNMKHEKGVF